jgi:hypothetical protein
MQFLQKNIKIIATGAFKRKNNLCMNQKPQMKCTHKLQDHQKFEN